MNIGDESAEGPGFGNVLSCDRVRAVVPCMSLQAKLSWLVALLLARCRYRIGRMWIYSREYQRHSSLQQILNHEFHSVQLWQSALARCPIACLQTNHRLRRLICTCAMCHVGQEVHHRHPAPHKFAPVPSCHVCVVNADEKSYVQLPNVLYGAKGTLAISFSFGLLRHSQQTSL